MKEASGKRNIILTFVVLAVIFAVTAVTVLILLGTQRKSDHDNDIRLTADEVASRVIKKMNYNNLTQISKQNINRYYEIPEGTVTDYAMYISGRSGSEVEIACFRLKNEDSRSALTAAINSYLNEKSPADVSGSSTQAASTVAVHYPYVLVVVAQDCDTAAKAFETILNDSLRSGQG
ncbi:MAG: DUF4358 domain-containing protein [Clostridia bacterium]|nr:DUF4358 domain-containing protein [Clostridia bacterium]